jgi:single-strand DNA-binding protein
MSDGMNKVILMGNLGADPELRTLPSGQSVLKIRLATNDSYLDRDRQRQVKTEWHDVSVWGPRGEALARHLTKGTKLVVEGRLHTYSYDKEGQKRTRTEVVAQDVYFAGGGRSRDRDTEERQEPASWQPPHSNGASPVATAGEIPF